MKIELRIGVDISSEQTLDDIHRRNRRTRTATRGSSASTAAAAATARAGGFFSIDDDVECRAPPPIPKLRIRSTIQQELGDIVMVVVEGEHQRSHTLGRRHVHI